MSTLKKLCLLGTAFLAVIACSKNSDSNTPGSDPVKKELPADPGPKYSDVTVENEATTEDNVANTTFDDSLIITFNGTSATVSGSIEDVEVSTSGAGVTATNSGDKKIKYILTGSSSDGFFKLYSGKKQAIVLQNLSLTNRSGAAINNQSKKRTFIVIERTNSLGDGEVDDSGKYPSETSDEDMKAALFSEGQLAFSGTGKLTVTAIGKAGITSDDYVRFLTGSDVTVTSTKGHGVRGKDAVIITGGTVNVALANTATGKKCFTTDSLMYMGGGIATLINNASAGILDGETEPTGAAGIKADMTFVIRGGTLNVTATGKGCKCISGDDTGFFEGGTVIAKATGQNYGSSGRPGEEDNSVSSKAIKFDGNLEFSGASVTASAASHEAIEAKGTIYVSGGTISATSSDDAINSGSTMNIAKGVVYACSTGNDGIDANGDCVIRGGTVYAVGCGTPETGIDANTEGGYKLYIQNANVISIAGIENNSIVNQAVISTSWNRNTTYSLCDSDNALFSFRTPSSGGQGIFISAPSLVSGSTYALKTGATVSGAEAYFDGILSIGGTASGGNSTNVTASNYSSGGGPGGGGGGGGGPVGPRGM